MTLKNHVKLVAKMTCGIWWILLLALAKSENLHFYVLLLTIAYKVSAKEVQKNYLSWHWKVIQTLKKSCLLVWKIAWGIWWTLTRAIENLKICILMDYFCRKYVMFEIKNTEKLCREKWLMVSEMVKGIWWIFTQVFESNIR